MLKSDKVVSRFLYASYAEMKVNIEKAAKDLKQEFPDLNLEKNVGRSGGSIWVNYTNDSIQISLQLSCDKNGVTGTLWVPPVQKGIKPPAVIRDQPFSIVLDELVKWLRTNKRDLFAKKLNLAGVAEAVRAVIESAPYTIESIPPLGRSGASRSSVDLKRNGFSVCFRAMKDHRYGQDFHLIDDDDERERTRRANYAAVESSYEKLIEQALLRYGVTNSNVYVSYGDKDYYDADVQLKL